MYQSELDRTEGLARAPHAAPLLGDDTFDGALAGYLRRTSCPTSIRTTCARRSSAPRGATSPGSFRTGSRRAAATRASTCPRSGAADRKTGRSDGPSDPVGPALRERLPAAGRDRDRRRDRARRSTRRALGLGDEGRAAGAVASAPGDVRQGRLARLRGEVRRGRSARCWTSCAGATSRRGCARRGSSRTTSRGIRGPHRLCASVARGRGRVLGTAPGGGDGSRRDGGERGAPRSRRRSETDRRVRRAAALALGACGSASSAAVLRRTVETTPPRTSSRPRRSRSGGCGAGGEGVSDEAALARLALLGLDPGRRAHRARASSRTPRSRRRSIPTDPKHRQDVRAAALEAWEASPGIRAWPNGCDSSRRTATARSAKTPSTGWRPPPRERSGAPQEALGGSGSFRGRVREGGARRSRRSRSRRRRRGPPWRGGSPPGGDGYAAASPSRMMRPSRTSTTRPARRASVMSCVITTSVRPCCQRSPKSHMTSLPEEVSRLPGRLVGEQDVGVHGERARDRDALHLAAGELRRLVVHPVAEADLGRAAPRPAPCASSRHAAEEQRHLDVLERRDLRAAD